MATIAIFNPNGATSGKSDQQSNAEEDSAGRMKGLEAENMQLRQKISTLENENSFLQQKILTLEKDLQAASLCIDHKTHILPPSDDLRPNPFNFNSTSSAP